MVFEEVISYVSNSIINLIGAILIVLMGIIIGKFFDKVIRRVLAELNTNKILKEEAGVKIPFEEFIGSIVKYLVYFAAVIMALNQLGITTIVLNIILGLILFLLIVFIVLAFKDFVPNLVSGLFLHQKREIKDGDRIRVDNIEGKIIHINLVETRVETKNGDVVYIPNSILTGKKVVKLKR